VLAGLATIFARRKTRIPIEFVYRDVWAHRAARYYFPHGNKFEYTLGSLVQIGCYENRCRRDAEDFWFQFYRPSKGDVIVDIGAGRGEDAFVFSEAVGPSGKVIAIEAHPASYWHLDGICKLNKLENVTALNLAITDHPGWINITDAPEWESNEIIRGGDGLRVRAETLDSITEKLVLPKIDFLKMNIEGAERDALLGMKRTIGSCKCICVACHDFRSDRGEGEHFRTRDFAEDFLTHHGFKILSRSSDPRDYVRDHIFGVR
jgi:FkbM family methyltransferase